jgi:hypothetical protein
LVDSADILDDLGFFLSRVATWSDERRAASVRSLRLLLEQPLDPHGVARVVDAVAQTADGEGLRLFLFDHFTAMVMSVAPADSSAGALGMAAQLRTGILHRAITRGWNERSLRQVLKLLAPPRSADGDVFRVRVFKEPLERMNRAQLRQDFTIIRQWEQLCTVGDEGVARGMRAVLDSNFRVRWTEALSRFEQFGATLPAPVWALIERACLEGGAAEAGVAGFLLSYANEQSDERVAMATKLVSLGVPTHVAVGSGNDSLASVYTRLSSAIREVQGAQTHLDAIVEGLTVMQRRSAQLASENGGSRLGENRIAHWLGDILRPDLGRLEALCLDPVGRQKLLTCLHARGVDPIDSVHDEQGLHRLLTEIHAQYELDRIVFSADSVARSGRSRRFAEMFKIDNPPFSILTSPESKIAEFARMTERVLRRQVDSYLGFWALTYMFRHTPISGRCQFDEFAAGVGGRLWVIPSSHVGRFPGRGRVLEGLELGRVFAGYGAGGKSERGSYWENQVFADYGPLPEVRAEGNQHALRNLQASHIFPFRGGFGFSCPGNPFFSIDGEPMSYIDFNHHFDPTGAHRGFLIPTRAVNELLFGTLIPYNPMIEDFPFKSDARLDPQFSLRRARNFANEYCRIGVVNLSSGSIYGGGLCNGLDPRSRPYFDWQKVRNFYLDGFGHPHKWNVRSDTQLLRQMEQVSRRIYEVATAYQNVRDVFKIALGFDARGWTNRRDGAPNALNRWVDDTNQPRRFELDGAASDLSESAGDPSATQAHRGPWEAKDMEVHFSGDGPRDPTFDDHDSMRGRYLLDLFADFIDESTEKGLPKDNFGSLVISNMDEWSTAPETPIVFHGRLGYVFRRGKPPLDLMRGGKVDRELIAAVWEDEVSPFLSRPENYWKAPRLVADDNYAKHVKAMAGRK